MSSKQIMFSGFSGGDLLVQVICLLVLIGLCLFVFKKYPLQVTIQNIVFAAMFVLLASVMNALSVMIPFFGVPSVKLSFVILVLIVAGSSLSPSWAYLVGLVFDLVGLLIVPTDQPFLGFTLSHVLVTLLPSLWYVKSQSMEPKLAFRIIYTVLICLGVGAAVYIFQMDEIQVGQDVVAITTVMKLSIVLFISVAIVVLFVVLRYMQKNQKEDTAAAFAKWMMIAIVGEVLYSIILTPLWLDVMYHIPWFVSMFIRVVKACVMIPIDIVVGFSLVKLVHKVSFASKQK
ncbi:ECF transporter S component (folate family) [Breznakia sp. PH1-1]|nr:ECF transporter S component (folate family) [Breznakia sp. PH1-1]MDH6403694.1 ECF transporter S component (folate family) [Breznakia sp. PF1-11]MDH6411403.1 ECF transporter S component (folate family) [Breznakia sp. PFB1-11]MDH6413866.1 ECF transporter S component (folate family) [Breznakia sp. PFB1-14]MDH6416296.1 ECF transporter S component (folate family) [Breznakia sp. PFB1-4]MDH6418534.1 ECF transporter S component (folate family) [Breznakia sp. PFB1-12]MDH6473648.1 ECF transporter S 